MLPIPTITVVPEVDLEVVILSIRSKVGLYKSTGADHEVTGESHQDATSVTSSLTRILSSIRAMRSYMLVASLVPSRSREVPVGDSKNLRKPHQNVWCTSFARERFAPTQRHDFFLKCLINDLINNLVNNLVKIVKLLLS